MTSIEMKLIKRCQITTDRQVFISQSLSEVSSQLSRLAVFHIFPINSVSKSNFSSDEKVQFDNENVSSLICIVHVTVGQVVNQLSALTLCLSFSDCFNVRRLSMNFLKLNKNDFWERNICADRNSTKMLWKGSELWKFRCESDETL